MIWLDMMFSPGMRLEGNNQILLCKTDEKRVESFSGYSDTAMTEIIRSLMLHDIPFVASMVTLKIWVVRRNARRASMTNPLECKVAGQ
jgi:hypothetical protein